jgi:phospholipase/carboxylesterase
VFERHAVDPGRVAIAGFSDGASYALSLGLANGELFSAVLAFSPGFAAPPSRHGAPRVFMSHGTGDRVLPVARTSRLIAPLLEASGLAVEYREFDGGHAIPAEIARAASAWLGWTA